MNFVFIMCFRYYSIHIHNQMGLLGNRYILNTKISWKNFSQSWGLRPTAGGAVICYRITFLMRSNYNKLYSNSAHSKLNRENTWYICFVIIKALRLILASIYVNYFGKRLLRSPNYWYKWNVIFTLRKK